MKGEQIPSSILEEQKSWTFTCESESCITIPWGLVKTVLGLHTQCLIRWGLSGSQESAPSRIPPGHLYGCGWDALGGTLFYDSPRRLVASSVGELTTSRDSLFHFRTALTLSKFCLVWSWNLPLYKSHPKFLILFTQAIQKKSNSARL